MAIKKTICIDQSKLTGSLFASMTNDYMFRAYMQYDEHALKGLISALLKMEYEDIKSLEITNPIDLSSSIAGKEFKLDLKLLLNNNTVINVELQIVNEENWPERSLSYICRAFDNINKGSDYLQVKLAIHIGILNYTLFEDEPEFYATYKMMNVRSRHIYSDKFVINIMDLSNIDRATEDDKKHKLDLWTRLFKATTWEELKMLAERSKYMDNTIVTIAKMSKDEKLRQDIEAREEFLRIQRTEALYKAGLEEDLAKARAIIAQREAAVSAKEREIEELKKRIRDLEG